MAEEKLTLEEMLSLAGKVENWTKNKNIGEYISYGLFGSIQNVKLKISWEESFWYTYYSISAKSKEVYLGIYKSKEKSNSGKKIKEIYNRSFIKAKENEQKEQKAREKNREDTLKYARGLLEK